MFCRLYSEVKIFILQKFDRINDYTTPSSYSFNPPIWARFLRLKCVDGDNAWRFELYGCDIGMEYDIGMKCEICLERDIY